MTRRNFILLALFGLIVFVFGCRNKSETISKNRATVNVSPILTYSPPAIPSIVEKLEIVDRIDSNGAVISGMIYGSSNNDQSKISIEPLSYVIVYAHNQRTKQKFGTLTSESGTYKFSLDEGIYDLYATYISGYNQLIVRGVTVRSGDIIVFNGTLGAGADSTVYQK